MHAWLSRLLDSVRFRRHRQRRGDARPMQRLAVDELLFGQLIAKYRDRWGGFGALGDDALVLHIGMGPMYYLSRDGYVLTGSFLSNDNDLHVACDDEAAEGLVLGSYKLDAPELLFLLPARPTDAVTCEQCSGTRWMRIEALNAEWLCYACHGRGWKVG